MTKVLTQTGAIFYDAYRELNARKMFWISLGISLLVVACFALIGINEKGISIAGFTIPGIPINTGLFSESFFYKLMFVNVGVNLWLGWASTILALVSTASIIPDFVSSGAIENMLARPISRVRLFLTKYLASLLFVFLQATVFTAASILVIGARSGEWLWGLMLGVPLVTLFFSYIYCVSALVGVWTRSTLAALLAALALWGVILIVGIAEAATLQWRVGHNTKIVTFQKDVEATQLQITKETQAGADADRLQTLRTQLDRKQADLIERQASLQSAEFWHNMMYAGKTILPKTAETKELLLRAIATDAELEKLLDDPDDQPGRQNRGFLGPADRRTMREVQKIINNRSVWWVLGTSAIFQLIILAWASRIFAKRDF